MKFIPRWIAAICLLGASTLATAGTLPASGFWVGYNEAWFGSNYGTWLTSNPDYAAPSRFPATLGVIDTWFAGMAKGNAKIVRIWLFPQLQGIVLGQSSPQSQSLTSDFLYNLITVFWYAKKHGLMVYVTALNGNDMTTAVGIPYLKNFYYNLLSNKYGERDAFKSNIFAPVLAYMNWFNTVYPGVIYAFDLMNEIEAPLNSSYFPTFWQGARDWIKNMAAFVKSTSPWLAVTASAGWSYSVLELTLGLFSGLGLDFYDVHVYADSGKYSGQTSLCNKVWADGVPIILGEYGQKSQTYSDSTQYNATANFLYDASTHCFSAALAWKYEDPLQTWLTHLRPDGTFRPAYYAIQYYGGLF
jgi:hypothetical protein